jgi:hypothetical protein
VLARKKRIYLSSRQKQLKTMMTMMTMAMTVRTVLKKRKRVAVLILKKCVYGSRKSKAYSSLPSKRY